MKYAEPLLDYGLIGMFCFVFMAVILALFWLGWKGNKAYIEELKADRQARMEMMQHLITNNNRLIENNNEMMKGFIDIVSSFKAMLNAILDTSSRKSL